MFTHSNAGHLPHGADSNPNDALQLALKEQLGLTKQQLAEQLAAQARAKAILEPVRLTLGDAYAGAWYDESSLSLAVAVTDTSHARWLEVMGADPIIVEHSLATLQEAASALQQFNSDPMWLESVTSWYVDYRQNHVAVEVLEGREAEAYTRLKSITRFGKAEEVYGIEPSPGRATTMNFIKGGDGYFNTDIPTPCSVGFSVEGGYITAAHCGWGNDAVVGYNQVPQGNFSGSTYPPQWDTTDPELPFLLANEDLAWVSTLPTWTPLPEINSYNAMAPTLSGSSNGVVGAYVCRYGQTTEGPHCGRIRQLDVSVVIIDLNLELVVPFKNLIQTDNCAAHGDSGGPLVLIYTPVYFGLATGTLTGGVPGCPGEGPAYFAPVNSALNLFDLTLLLPTW